MARLWAEDENDELLGLLPKEEPKKTQEEINEEESKSRDAEAVIAFLRGEVGRAQYCKNCEGLFFTSYGCVAYCSDACRKEVLHKMGIDWDPMKPLHQRWGNKIPLVIPEETLHQLRDKIQLALDQAPVKQNVLSELTPAQ
jgi:hypothetical protein